MPISEKIIQLNEIKNDIKTSIEKKNVSLSGVPFSEYDDKINIIGDKYTRPSFWPELPEIAVDENGVAVENVIYALVAVFPNDVCDNENFIRTRNVYPISVDWGDGSEIENFNTNETISHKYNYDAITGDVCERGYKIVQLTIRPLSALFLHVGFYSSIAYRNGGYLLHIKASPSYHPSAAAFVRCNNQPYLEIYEIVGNAELDGYCLQYCPNIKQIIYDVKNIRTKSSIFATGDGSIRSYQMVEFSNGNVFDFSNANNLSSMFAYTGFKAKRIQIKSPIVDYVTNYMFMNSFVSEIVFDDASHITNTGNNMFANLPWLQYLRLPGIRVSFAVGSGYAYSRCNLSDSALNLLFGDLADMIGESAPTIIITGCPGASTCDTTIATNKNWVVVN